MKEARSDIADALQTLHTRPPPVPWEHGAKIPWDDPDFSQRVLRVHLSQDDDRASRPFETIDRHVAWLQETVLGGRSSRILDLGCGPGLYCERFARLGHRCLGIDFSPASIAYAREQAASGGLDVEYRQADLRTADLGRDHDLALMAFGEINAFPRAVAASLLSRVAESLAPGGRLVLEVHDEDCVRSIGEAASSWFTADASVFADEPHLCLRESAWSEAERASAERSLVVRLEDGATTRMTSTLQAYTDDEYRALLGEVGFRDVARVASLAGDDGPVADGLFVWTATAGLR